VKEKRLWHRLVAAIAGFVTAFGCIPAVQVAATDIASAEVVHQSGARDILILVMAVIALGSLIAMYVIRWNKRKWTGN
jgi:hypothetical protein